MGSSTIYVTNNWYVDHTSAVVDGVGFGCSGDIGKPGDRVALTANIDLEYARIIGAFDKGGTRAVYDRNFYDPKHLSDPNLAFLPFGDCCGLIYGVQGVCHTMANRILYAGNDKGTVNFSLGSFSGCASWFAYGYYGRGAISPYVNLPILWQMYIALCKFAKSLSSQSNSQSLEDFMYSLKAEDAERKMQSFIAELKNELNAGTENFYKKTLKHELNNYTSANLAIDRTEMFFSSKANLQSNSETNSIMDSFGNVEHSIKRSEELFAKQNRQMNSSVCSSYSIAAINDEFQKFNEVCYETLGNVRYKSVFGADYKRGIIVVDTEKPAENGLFAARFSCYQVFECFRTPAYPDPNMDFKVYNFSKPYILATNMKNADFSKKVFYLEGIKGANDTIRQLSLWMADDVNKSNPVCLVANGSAYGLHAYGLLYDSDIRIGGSGYGYYFSTTRTFDYDHQGDQMIWRPVEGKVLKFSDLEKYTFALPTPIYK